MAEYHDDKENAVMEEVDHNEALLQHSSNAISAIDKSNRGEYSSTFFASVRFKLYCSYFLSSWGDRMWAFALSIALGVIGGNLKYTAASGLVNSAAVLLLASVIGKRIDKTPRLRAATISLIANNTTVAMSAGILVLLLFFSNEIHAVWNGHLTVVLIWLSIVLCAFSMLADVGTKICVTKDWVVVISGKDAEKLADINAMMVRIDMTAYVLSPLLAGQFMSSFGTGWGCAFIGFWNIGSFAIEYYMLLAIYKSCPELSVKAEDKNAHENVDSQVPISNSLSSAHTDPPSNDKFELPTQTSTRSPANVDTTTICVRFTSTVRTAIGSLIGGYRTYFRQSVTSAGLGLACLYLSVIAFDGTTLVYLVSLGEPENFVALSQGLGAIMAIVGSVLYPRLRKRIGIDRTGLVALTIEWSCLILPVVSIWLPGSNFDPGAIFGDKVEQTSSNCSFGGSMHQKGKNFLLDGASVAAADCANATGIYGENESGSKISLVVFLVGVIFSRMGLWMADLTISQIFQEQISESERGVVNGVQNSLNSVMDIAKSILVIILPNPHTFGILIIISWISVFCGYCFYCHYSRRKRGHLLPFHNQFGACVKKDELVEISRTDGASEQKNDM